MIYNLGMTKSKLRQQQNLSESSEDYLKTIYLLREEMRAQNTPDERISTNDLASHMSVSPASVTGMMKKLAECGLVIHRPYYGVELTDLGEQIALEIVRHHRLLELYLTNHIGFSWDEVHDQADVLEHAISEEFEDRIDMLLGYPTHDPHGDPIPTKAGAIIIEPLFPLSEAVPSPAVSWKIMRVKTQNSEKLRFLTALGLVLGDSVTILERDPFGGLHIAIASHPDEIILISDTMARIIWVEKAI